MISCSQVRKTYLSSSGNVQWSLEALRIAAGENILVTGPSGCGKTTFLNLIAGLLRPDAGAIAINDTRIDQLTPAELDLFRGQHIGLIFQSFQLLPSLTARDNVLLGARYGRKWSPHEAREKADVLLRQVGLQPVQHARPNRLSLGEQQRVAIARALINDPILLLADEPTASLDEHNATCVLDLLFELSKARGTTLVMVSHDTRHAPRFSRSLDAGAWLTRTGATEASHV